MNLFVSLSLIVYPLTKWWIVLWNVNMTKTVLVRHQLLISFILLVYISYYSRWVQTHLHSKPYLFKSLIRWFAMLHDKTPLRNLLYIFRSLFTQQPSCGFWGNLFELEHGHKNVTYVISSSYHSFHWSGLSNILDELMSWELWSHFCVPYI